jgi:uncharacterized protein with HEPN domain
MKKQDDAFYLEGIHEHVSVIRSYIPASKDLFLADEKTQDAVLMRRLALGEDISHLSDDFKDNHPNLHWYKIVGLRNRIAHGYFEIDPELVWETLTDGSLGELETL